MSEFEQGWTIEELSEQTNIPVRTIRYYISQGLLTGPGTRGKNAIYRKEHLVRLRLIRQLTDAYLPLQEIRAMLMQMTDEEVEAMLAQGSDSARFSHANTSTAPRAVIASILQRSRSDADTGDIDIFSRQNPAGSPRQSPQDPRRSAVWRHWQIADGIELSVRDDVYQRQQKKLAKLIEQMEQTLRNSPESHT